MRAMDLEPEEAIAALRRRRQWTLTAALLTLLVALGALAAASLGMYSSEIDAAKPALGQ